MNKKYTEKRLETSVSVPEYIKECVDVEKFLAYCKKCPNYGKSHACPPFDFEPMDIWRGYSTVRLAAKQIFFSEDTTLDEAYKILLEKKHELLDEMAELEKTYPGSLALSAGSCDICPECAKKTGEKCRFPQKLRYSIEALGGDVVKTAEKYLKVPILWSKNGEVPEYFIPVAGILLKDERES